MSRYSDKLWTWFQLSYASFLVLPRVLMHEMPIEWQDKMADLLSEYDEAYPNQPDMGTQVRATDMSGKLIPMPRWLREYRRPDLDEVMKVRSYRSISTGKTSPPSGSGEE